MSLCCSLFGGWLVNYPWSEDPHQNHLHLYWFGHLIQERAVCDSLQPPPGACHSKGTRWYLQLPWAPAKCTCNKRPSVQAGLSPSTYQPGCWYQPAALPALGCDVNVQEIPLINMLVLSCSWGMHVVGRKSIK